MKDGIGWGWLFLILAIGFELSGTISMKLSQGFTKLWPSILMFVCYGISFTSLNFALHSFKISVAYAIWSGAGIILITVAGVFFFSERLSLASLLWSGVIVAGVVGLNLSAKVH
ncbi:DMT family transporter [Paenibacillus sp. GCM10012307]|uniref:Multidrug efflux SMR transporter n=1 Tax=Paenibacillus roseus TaxID=2798579 RepID=A0A934J865_9BACL|nr:multidrug efflux SMR transporter [Paenibacillus roseus]MBJ6362150.1 multidrug efflux SMR transporter [Paenibacillus roseus]